MVIFKSPGRKLACSKLFHYTILLLITIAGKNYLCRIEYLVRIKKIYFFHIYQIFRELNISCRLGPQGSVFSASHLACEQSLGRLRTLDVVNVFDATTLDHVTPDFFDFCIAFPSVWTAWKRKKEKNLLKPNNQCLINYNWFRLQYYFCRYWKVTIAWQLTTF
jgi:hypothetical protein